MKGSWKTTVAGYCVLLGTIFTSASAVLDSDPKTTISWEAIAAAMAGVGLIFARDNSVTSEKAGAK